MKNQNLSNGKRLSKKQLLRITGGKEMCFDMMTGECKKYGPFCGEKECQTIPDIDL